MLGSLDPWGRPFTWCVVSDKEALRTIASLKDIEMK